MIVSEPLFAIRVDGNEDVTVADFVFVSLSFKLLDLNQLVITLRVSDAT